MRKILLAGAATIALSIGAAGTANAGLLTIVGGSSGSIPGGSINELLGPLGFSNPLSGFYGANLQVSGAATLTFEYFGFEAGFVNRFRVNGVDRFTTEDVDTGPSDIEIAADLGSPLETYTLSNPADGVVPFSFFVDNLGNGVANGANNPNTLGLINFFLTTALAGNPDTGDAVYVWLDDTGGDTSGHPDDDNHDDMMIRITASTTPIAEPASLAVFGMALAGLGLLRRRPRAKA